MKINLNLTTKILEVDGKPLSLEDSLCGGGIEEANNGETVLNLEYPAKQESESDVYEEMDKIQSTYGDSFIDNYQVSGSFCENRHYLSITGKMDASVERRG